MQSFDTNDSFADIYCPKFIYYIVSGYVIRAWGIAHHCFVLALPAYIFILESIAVWLFGISGLAKGKFGGSFGFFTPEAD